MLISVPYEYFFGVTANAPLSIELMVELLSQHGLVTAFPYH